MHDLLYANAPDFGDNQIQVYMKQAGLDLEKAEKDRKDPAVLDRIRKEKEEGMAFGMVGTPGIFINSKFYRGVKTENELIDRIEAFAHLGNLFRVESFKLAGFGGFVHMGSLIGCRG